MLHVELASDDDAERIAAALWVEIQAGAKAAYGAPLFLRGLRCLRFLVEAFRGRRAAIRPFEDALFAFVERKLAGEEIIPAKLAAETIGLLSAEHVEKAMPAALQRGDFWVRDTAIEACRQRTCSYLLRTGALGQRLLETSDVPSSAVQIPSESERLKAHIHDRKSAVLS